jgi:hypothetical protein
VLTYGRWIVLLCCLAAVFVTGMRLDSLPLAAAGIIGTMACVGGIFIDVFRDHQIRSLQEELIIHRRTEAHRRNLNQRGRA